MTPTPPSQVDAAANRISAPKAAKSLANEFAALLAQFDEPGPNDELAGRAQEARQGGPREDGTGKDNGKSTTTIGQALKKGAEALAPMLRESTSIEPAADRIVRLAKHADHLERKLADAKDPLARLERQIEGKAEDLIDLAPPALRRDAALQGLQTIPEIVAKVGAQVDEGTPNTLPTIGTARAETTKMVRPRLAGQTEAALGRNGSASSADAPQGPLMPTDGEVRPESTARERFALRLGPLADRTEQHLSRGAARQGDGEAMIAKPLGQISISRQETHLAPVRQPTAIADHVWRRHVAPEIKADLRAEPAKTTFAGVVDQISQALDGTRSEADAKMQQATQHGTPSRPLSPVKIVEISLQPASLGAIAITMRLTGSGLRVTVSATSRETAEQLREDRDALATLVEGAGYDASEIIVTHRPQRDPQPTTG